MRKAATEAEGGFFDQHRQELDELYDKLVKNRTQQAKKLGFENYVPLGFIRMGRNCYTRGPPELPRSGGAGPGAPGGEGERAPG